MNKGGGDSKLFHQDNGLDGVNLYMDLDVDYIKEYRPDGLFLVMI